jgi:threonine dehydrogenase-like Zn-dependent dehydrogenase
MRGYTRFHGVLGHEFVGIVDRAEDSELVGQRVVGEINASCGRCETCLAGRPTHCPDRTVPGIHGRDGCLAEWFCLPARNLHPVPAEIPDEVAVFAEPLAAACQILDQVQVRPTSRVLVLGDGKLGLLVSQVLSLTGCDLTVVGRHASKLAILAKQGIETVVGDQDLPGNADLAVECTGRAEGFYSARRLVRPRGTIILKSTYRGLVEADLSSVAVDEVQILGSRCGPFPPALRLLARRLVDVESMIEAKYPLDEGVRAIEHAGRRGALKVLVHP